MRVARAAVLACLALLAGANFASAQKPEELIIGKWELADPKEKMTVEFQKGGKLLLEAPMVKFEGTYKFLNDTEMEVALTFGGETKKEKLKVKVTKDELITTDSENKVDKFKRVK